MVANAGSTRSPISRDGTSQSRPESKRFSRRERAICRPELRRAGDISARLGGSKAVRNSTMLFLPAPFAAIRPEASRTGTKSTDVVDSHCIAEVAGEPLEHDRGSRHEQSTSNADTGNPAIWGHLDPHRARICPESGPGIGRGRVAQLPPEIWQSADSRDMSVRRLRRERFVLMSPDSANIDQKWRFFAPCSRG